MWFRTIYLKTLRGFRVPILGWGGGWGLLMLVVFLAIPSLIATPAARASLLAIGPTFAWLAAPIKIDTPGGYATWKYGSTILLVAIWPILAETGMLRGEEERGALDVLLSVPRTRVRIALDKVGAMWTALLAMGLLVGAGALLGALKVGGGIGAGDALLFGLNLALIAAVFGAIALFLSQFIGERRTAAGASSGLLLLFIVMDMAHRVTPSAEWLSRLSPVYYFNLSKPLVPGYGADGGGMLVLTSITAVLTAAAVWLFARRDVNDTVPLPRWLRLPPRHRRAGEAVPVRDWSLRSVYMRGLAMVWVPTAWWTLAIAGFGSWMVVIVQQTAAQLRSLLDGSAMLKGFVSVGGTDGAILSALFIFLPLLLMAFAVTQANRWSADEEDGRLELILSTPQSRLAVLLGRFAALATATVIIALVTLALTAFTAVRDGVALDMGNLAAATLGMIPLGLLVAAIGYLAAGWLRTAVETGLLSFVLVIWFVISFIGPGLSWPDGTLRLSAFYYYGTPLLHGIQVGDMLLIVAIGALALVLGSLRFARKDIGV